MSVEGDLFRVTVKGSRESIIKMMNAALKSFNSDNVIADSDDAKTMNSKLEMFAGEEGKDIGIPDLLRQGKEGDSFVRKIEFVRIEDDSRGLVAKFSYYLGEACLYLEDMGCSADYLDSVTNWEAVALQYGCTVFLDDDWYSNGQFIRFGAATIYDASDGELHRLHLESGSIYDDKEYPFFLKTLAHLYPDHYGVNWEHYHSKHPEVEISEDECLAWFNEQKQPWDQEASSRGALRLPAQLFQRASSKSISKPSTDAPAKMRFIRIFQRIRYVSVIRRYSATNLIYNPQTIKQ